MLPSASRLAISLCIAVLLVATPIRWAAASPAFYQVGFARHAVASGLNEAELERLAAALIAYFGSNAEPLAFSIEGQPLFNPRETAHLADVKGLIRLVARLQETAAIVGLGATVAIAAALRSGGRRRYVLGALRWGAIGAAVLTLGVGLGAGLGFDRLFLWFHFAAFRNELWMLDPSTDVLIRLFPPALFFEATLAVGAAILAEAAVLYAAASILSRRH